MVDVQNDFIDGTLALRNCGYGQEAVNVIKPINQILKAGRWDKVIYTLDWHPKDHISFFENLAMRQLHSDSKVLCWIIGRTFYIVSKQQDRGLFLRIIYKIHMFRDMFFNHDLIII